jgi:hypothetical protein
MRQQHAAGNLVALSQDRLNETSRYPLAQCSNKLKSNATAIARRSLT